MRHEPLQIARPEWIGRPFASLKRILGPGLLTIGTHHQARHGRGSYIHPFREGNGRTQRAFLDQVARVSGRRLAWRNVTSREHLTASIRAFNAGNGEPFRPILELVRQPPLDGLSPLDPSVYQVTKPR
ncbi:MAG: toxin-antitoxin system, toxin component [Microbacterium sp.]|nr:toxin-antitoxin system, toxin component [Microbacterium sp.]